MARLADRKTLSTMFNRFICPVIEYGDVLYNNCTMADSPNIEEVKKCATMIVTGAVRSTSSQITYKE